MSALQVRDADGEHLPLDSFRQRIERWGIQVAVAGQVLSVDAEDFWWGRSEIGEINHRQLVAVQVILEVAQVLPPIQVGITEIAIAFFWSTDRFIEVSELVRRHPPRGDSGGAHGDAE